MGTVAGSIVAASRLTQVEAHLPVAQGDELVLADFSESFVFGSKGNSILTNDSR